MTDQTTKGATAAITPSFDVIGGDGSNVTVVTNGREIVGGPIDSDEALLIAAGSARSADFSSEASFPAGEVGERRFFPSIRPWPDHIPVPSVLSAYCASVHAGNVKAGWWNDLATGAPLDRNVGELLMLVVSEIREGWQGLRGGLMDDKLPHRQMLEVELADALIRIYDIAGAHNLDIGGAVSDLLLFDKLEGRLDHVGFMMIVDEVCRAMEGHRKGAQDEALPQRSAFTVGLAAAVVRIYAMGKVYRFDLTGAIAEKRAFNATREDHKAEIRRAAGGKAY